MNLSLVTPFLGVAVYVGLLTLTALDSGARVTLRQSGFLDLVGFAVGAWTVTDAWRSGTRRFWPSHFLGWLLLALCGWVAASAMVAAQNGMWTPETYYRTKQFGLAAVVYFATTHGFAHRWHVAALTVPMILVISLEAADEYNTLYLDQNLTAFAVLGIAVLTMTAGAFGRRGLLATMPFTVAMTYIAAVTRNRGGGLALLGTMFMLAAQSRRRWLWLGMLVATMAVVIARYGDADYFSRYRDIATRGPAYGTAQTRLEFWKQGLQLAKEHPVFGVGPGNFGNATGRGEDPHSHLVAMISETGYPGAVFYSAFFLAALGIAAWRGRFGGFAGTAARASATGLVGFMIAGMFLGLQTNSLAFVFAGIAHVAGRLPRDD